MNFKEALKLFDNFLDNTAANIQPPVKIAILAGVILIPAVIFYFTFWSPKAKEISALTSKEKRLNTEIARLEKATKKIKQIEEEARQTALLYAAASELLPEKKEIPTLLATISSQGTEAGLEIKSFQPSPEKPETFYASIPMRLSVSGTYHQTGVFLDKVSKMPRIISVTEVSIGSPKHVGGEVLLNSSLSLLTYKFIEKRNGTQ